MCFSLVSPFINIWSIRKKGNFLFALALMAIALLFVMAWEYRDWFCRNKDAISAIESAVTMVVLVVGSLFSYYRFFRGRILSFRLDLDLVVTVHKTPEGYLIHAVSLKAKNIGNSTVWDPTPKIMVRIHGPEEIAKEYSISHWLENVDLKELDDDKHMPFSIEPGETSPFFTQQHIPNKAWAVTYLASIRAEKNVWCVSQTVSNKES